VHALVAATPWPCPAIGFDLYGGAMRWLERIAC